MTTARVSSYLARRLPISPRSIAGQSVDSVLARDLHSALGISRGYAKWFREQIKRADLAHRTDYLLLDMDVPQSGSGGHNRQDHGLTADAAKKIAMLSETPAGNEVREYFIECERVAIAPQSMAEKQLEVLQHLIAEVAEEREGRLLAEATIEDQRPTIEWAADLADSRLRYNTREAIKRSGLDVRLNAALWAALDSTDGYFSRTNGVRKWRSRFVREGFGDDDLVKVAGGKIHIWVPRWTEKGVAHLRHWLKAIQRQGVLA